MTDIQTFKERLQTFLTSIGMSVMRFEQVCGFSNGSLNKLRKAYSGEKLYKISSVFPQLNIDWLLTGEGEMIKDKVVCEDHVPYSTKPSTSTFSYGDIKEVLNELKTLKQKIDVYEGRIENYEKERKTLIDHMDKLTSIISKLTDERAKLAEKIDNDNNK